MTDLAYMTREDWGQHGTAMHHQSSIIRAWLGNPPFVFATTSLKRYESSASADREFVGFVAPSQSDRVVVETAQLRQVSHEGAKLRNALVILHPFQDAECEIVRQTASAGAVARMCIVVWSPTDPIRRWLDGAGAIDLHTGRAANGPDPVQLEAARCWVKEQYNGLSGGNGKSAVVQIIRAFTRAGYALDADTWLRAFFAAGGNFDEAAAVAKLIREMQQGVRHRIKERYRPDIFEVLRAQAMSEPAQP